MELFLKANTIKSLQTNDETVIGIISLLLQEKLSKSIFFQKCGITILTRMQGIYVEIKPISGFRVVPQSVSALLEVLTNQVANENAFLKVCQLKYSIEEKGKEI